jgi:hypothetical protein
LPGDFNAQLDGWLMLANQQQRRTLGCAPTDRIDVDRSAMLRLPPVGAQTGWRSLLRLPATTMCGWTATTTRSTRPRLVAGWRWPPTLTASASPVMGGWSPITSAAGPATRPQGPAHLAAAARLHRDRTAQPSMTSDDVEVRCLADYDQVFGLDKDAGVA